MVFFFSKWSVAKSLLKVALVGACALVSVHANARHHSSNAHGHSFVAIPPHAFGMCDIPETRYSMRPQDRWHDQASPLF